MNVNRMSEFFGDGNGTTATAVLRSPAQREASRINGAKSHGPISAAGKTKSRMNALKHGLLSKVLQPTHAQPELRMLHRQVLKGLKADFQPTTFTQHLRVELLADDIKRLLVARRMVASLSTPALSTADAAKLKTLDKTRQQLRLIKQAQATADKGAPWALRTPHARQLAEAVNTLVAGIEADLAEDNDPDLVPPEGIEFEQRRQRDATIAAAGKSWQKLGDRELLEGVFTGARRPSTRQRTGIIALLQLLATRLGDSAYWQGQVETRVQGAADQALAILTRQPEGLMLLDRYQSRLERSISRQMLILEGR